MFENIQRCSPDDWVRMDGDTMEQVEDKVKKDYQHNSQHVPCLDLETLVNAIVLSSSIILH